VVGPFSCRAVPAERTVTKLADDILALLFRDSCQTGAADERAHLDKLSNMEKFIGRCLSDAFPVDKQVFLELSAKEAAAMKVNSGISLARRAEFFCLGRFGL
jgi:hypothetical protein